MPQTSKQKTLSALNDALVTSTLLTGTICVQVTGTFVGTLVFEGTVDGGTLFAVNGTPPTSSTSVVSVTGPGQWLVQAAGYSQFQTRFSVYVSGSAVVSHGTGEVSQPAPSATGAGGGGGGAVTIADGADVTQGAIADPAVAAGAAGSDSAKLRRLTTDLSALLTAAAPAPPAASIFAGASSGTGTQAATDIAGATGITANKVFTGWVTISAAASQTAALAAAGFMIVTVTWVPGTSGTVTQRVATVNLLFGLGGITNLTAPHCEETVTVPVQLYVGTTAGKFQASVLTTGTVTTLAWDVSVTGSAQ